MTHPASPNEKLREEIIAIFKDDNWFPTDHPYYIDDLINLFSIHLNATLQSLIDEGPKEMVRLEDESFRIVANAAIAAYSKLIESKKGKADPTS